MGSEQGAFLLTRGSELQKDSHLGLEHFEFTPSPGSAEQLAAVPGGHPCILGDPL